MNIPWKLKSAGFAAIDFFNAPRVLYFLQKNITRRSRASAIDISPNWLRHSQHLEKHGATGLVLEFGAGKTLAQNLYLSNMVDRQLVVDLNRMIDVNLVEAARRSLSKTMSMRSDCCIEGVADLERYGIAYRAPFDVAESKLDDKSVDGCISTNTLEHVPRRDIVAIFDEVHRILKDDGIVSVKIDYTDHYAHTDRGISLLNYLRYDEQEWRTFNHRCHYQNRLRHSDYIRIFEAAGFSTVEEYLGFSEVDVPDDIATSFQGHDESWKATSGHLVLKKS